MRALVSGLAVLLAASPVQAQLWDRIQKWTNPEVEVMLTHPPELGIRIQRLAFAPVATPVENDLLQALVADLSGTGELEILDRTNVERILREQKFSNSGIVDEQTAVQLGKLLGSPALVIVKVHHFAFTPSRRQDLVNRKEKVDGKEVERKHAVHFAAKQGDFVASIQAVDLASGRIYSAKRVVASPKLENRQEDTPPDFPADAQLREMAIGDAVKQVRRMILPWNETRKLIFFDDSDYGMKEAFQRLKLKDVAGALVKSQDAHARARAEQPSKPKYVGRTAYNVGMCHFITGDCETALPFLKAAQETDPDSGIYRAAVTEGARGAQLQADLRKATQAVTGPVPKGEEPKTAEAPKASEGKPALEERLQRLEGLFKKGIISEDEYKKRREELLREI